MKYLFGLFCCVLLASCHMDGSYYERLSELDAILKDNPRQVYDSLTAISPQRMGGADRAYYYVLQASASDKIYQKLVSDSLLQISQKHFAATGDYYNLSRTQYYLAKYYGEKDVAKSYDLFKQAELNFQKGDQSDRYFYGLIAFQLGYVQYNQFNLDESRHYFEKARNLYIETADTLAHVLALRQLSLVAMRNKEYVESERLLTEAGHLLDKKYFADPKQQVKILITLTHSRSFLYQMQKKYALELNSAREVVRLLDSIGEDISSRYYLHLVDAYNRLDEKDSVRLYGALMLAAAEREGDLAPQISAYRRLIDVEEGNENYKEACLLQKKYLELRDSATLQFRTKDVLELEKRYNIAEKERLILKGKNRNLVLLLVILLVVFMLLGVWFYYRWVHRRLRLENAKLSEKVTHTKWGFALSKVLISDNMSLHDQWDKLLMRNHINLQNPKFYAQFLELSRTQKEDYTNRLFLTLVDIDKGFVLRVQERCPTLTMEEILLSTMIRHQWKLTDISEVFRISIDAVKKRKQRLKIKLLSKEKSKIAIDDFLRNL